MKNVILILFTIFISRVSLANSYTCAQMVYKEGWLVKYETLGNTWGANTKKMGTVSSMLHSTIEKTTASVDPGVTTGQFMSTSQYSSSWGECSILEYQITMEFREKYIEQNRNEIIQQIAQGHGHHVDSLALISGCRNIDIHTWSKSLQNKTAEFYDSKSSSEFAQTLQNIINKNSSLKDNCRMRTVAVR